MIRVIIDTNVALSGLLWWGEPAKLLERAQAGEFQILVAVPMIEDLTRIIYLNKFKKRFDELGTTVEEPLIFYRNLVKYCETPPKLQIKCEDSDNLIFIELAVAESAHFIVSGDSHLLDLKKVREIPIINSRQAHQLLNQLNKK